MFIIVIIIIKKYSAVKQNRGWPFMTTNVKWASIGSNRHMLDDKTPKKDTFQHTLIKINIVKGEGRWETRYTEDK